MLPIPSLLGSKLLDEVQRRIKAIGENYYGLNEVRLTPNEFIQAFIMPEHVPVLMRASELCGGIAVNSSYPMKLHPENDPEVRVTLRLRGDCPVPIPTYVGNGLSEQCPSLLRDRIMSWVTDRVYAGDILGDLYDAITIFDRTLHNLRSFAIMVPCLPMIVQSLRNGSYEKILKKMGKGTDFKLPNLPPEVAERVQKSNAFYTGLSMLTIKPTSRSAHEIWLERAIYAEQRQRLHIFRNSNIHNRLSLRSGTSL